MQGVSVASTKPWVLFVWHGRMLQGPMPGPGAFPKPGDRLPVRISGVDHPVLVRVIRTREGVMPAEAVAVTSAVPSSARRPGRPRLHRSAGLPPPAPPLAGESVNLQDWGARVQTRESPPTDRIRPSAPLVPPESPSLDPALVGRDEPDVGAILREVLGRGATDASTRRLRDALVPSLRHPLRVEIRRLTEERPADRGYGYLADRFRRMLRHLNVLESVVAGTAADPERAPRLARWLVQENVMLRQEIQAWLRLKDRLRQTK